MIVSNETRIQPLIESSPPIAADQRTYLFGSVVVRIYQRDGVWELTPHGQALGDGMAKARHALVGKSALEIGAGNGVHAIAALKLGARQIDITDIHSAALDLAVENAAVNNVSLRNVRQRDWLNFDPDDCYDVLLCNPPFCKAGTNNRRHFIQELIRQSPRFLRSGGHLLFVQSSMADFARTERELQQAGYYFTIAHQTKHTFRDYYFEEPGFLEESRQVTDGFEVIDDTYVETLRVYCSTKP